MYGINNNTKLPTEAELRAIAREAKEKEQQAKKNLRQTFSRLPDKFQKQSKGFVQADNVGKEIVKYQEGVTLKQLKDKLIAKDEAQKGKIYKDLAPKAVNMNKQMPVLRYVYWSLIGIVLLLTLKK